jgi:hypothetical protein
VSTTPCLKALHDASPRNQPDFDALLERYKELRTQITSTPLDSAGRSRRPAHRRRLIGLSAAFTAAAATVVVVGSLTLGGASPQSAYAAAHKALAATSAQRSGTMILTVNGARLSIVRWNHHRIALEKDQSSPLVLGHVLGPNLQMRLIGGGVYVQGPDGTWTHYASKADVGDKLGPEVEGLAAQTHPNNALEILSVASNLDKTSGPDGTTMYTGTIRNAHIDPQMNLLQNEVTGMLAKLRGGGASDADAPGGRYPAQSKLTLVVGHDGLVKRISFIFQQPYCRAGFPNCPQYGPPTSPHKTITWSVQYSHLGDNQLITPPTTATTIPK